MSERLPVTAARERSENLAVLLRETFVALNDEVLRRISEAGHDQVRAAHGAVFQYLDDAGTTVSLLAERAQMTKQSMAELVAHVERHGYVVRVPDPSDGRARLVQATDRGREVFIVARDGVVAMEAMLGKVVGPGRRGRLRADLEAIRAHTRSRGFD